MPVAAQIIALLIQFFPIHLHAGHAQQIAHTDLEIVSAELIIGLDALRNIFRWGDPVEHEMSLLIVDGKCFAFMLFFHRDGECDRVVTLASRLANRSSSLTSLPTGSPSMTR